MRPLWRRLCQTLAKASSQLLDWKVMLQPYSLIYYTTDNQFSPRCLKAKAMLSALRGTKQRWEMCAPSPNVGSVSELTCVRHTSLSFVLVQMCYFMRESFQQTVKKVHLYSICNNPVLKLSPFRLCKVRDSSESRHALLFTYLPKPVPQALNIKHFTAPATLVLDADDKGTVIEKYTLGGLTLDDDLILFQRRKVKFDLQVEQISRGACLKRRSGQETVQP